MARVKSKYEDAILKVEQASKTLQTLFKKKVRNIKEKSALFFTKVELKLKECNDDVLEVSKVFRKWEQTMQGPSKKLDAQLFSLKTEQSAAESIRETEFGLLKDVVKKLVNVLEDKASTDLITGNQSFTSGLGMGTNELATMSTKQIEKDHKSTLSRRKASQPPPMNNSLESPLRPYPTLPAIAP